MEHARFLKYGLVTLLAVALVVGHGFVLYRLTSHMARAIVLGLILLVLLKHIGLLSSVHAFLKRRSRGST